MGSGTSTMSTANTYSNAALAAAQRQRVQRPLQGLRSRIRFYVLAEGICLAGIFLALWFWIGLALDYGFFKLFRLDWVEELPAAFRAVLLWGILVGFLALLVFRLFFRLLHSLSNRALALVLERRFPIELNDRLITAVELSDPVMADRYGYSGEMVEKTIRDAADQVEQLPIDQVFDWHHLRRTGIRLAALSIGIYLLV